MSTSLSQNSGADFACNANGYIQAVQEITKLALSLITIIESAGTAVITAISPDLGTAIKLLYNFLVASTSWIGYAITAVYYVGEEYGFGTYLCQASGYAYYVIYYLEYAISFGQG